MRFSTIIPIVYRNIEIFFRNLFHLAPRPYKILLELTDHCNSRCQTCSIWKKDSLTIKNEFSVQLAEKLFSDYGKNLLWIALSGGEITLYDDFEELIKIIEKYCPNLKLVTFTTNGLNPSKTLKYAQCLKKLGCDVFITVSLDGDETTHDLVRGVPGNYKKALETYNCLLQDNITVHWGITLSHLNSSFAQSDHAILSDIKAVTFAHSGGIYNQENVFPRSSLFQAINAFVKHYRITNIGEFFEWVYIRLSSLYVASEGKISVPCEVITSNLHVRANGDIKPCMFVPTIGNLRESNMPSVLHHPSLLEKVKKYRKRECPGCWMNCYAPHSMMQNPFQSIFYAFFSRKNKI